MSYDAWGKGAETGSVLSDFGYTDHFLDRPTNLDLTWYRPYDAAQGRWLSMNPIGIRGGLNVYGYVGNDVLNRVDASGAEPIDFAKCLLNGGGLRKCIQDERERLDHGPAGDCQNCAGGGGAGPPPGGGPPGDGPYRGRDPDAIDLDCKRQAAHALKECLKNSYGKGAGAAIKCFDDYNAMLAKSRKDAGLQDRCPSPIPFLPGLPVAPIPVPAI
jgi:RHS repeat-associated protein